MSRAILTALVVLGLANQPALAQDGGGPNEPDVPVVALQREPPASSFADARLVHRRSGRRTTETQGALVSDAQARQLRFEADNRVELEVSYDSIAALHYESAAKYPRRLFLRHVEYHLVIHYLDETSRETFATIGLSKESVPVVLGAIEADSGLKVDTTVRPGSFLGMPLRIAVGDKVTVTEWSGRKAKRRITRLGRSSISVEEPHSPERVINVEDIQKVRLTYSPKNDALQGFAVGSAIGTLISLPWCSEYDGDRGECVIASFGVGAVFGGILAGVAVASGALGHTIDTSQDAYVSPTTPIRRASSAPRPDRSSSESR